MSDRYMQGLQVMESVLGETGKKIVEDIAQSSEEMARLYVEVPFTDIYSRGILDYKTRELIAVAALTCIGDSEPQLESHILGAIHVGCTQDEIKEAILQMSVFAGFPKAINSLTVAKKVFMNQKEQQL
jgi:4-carboxymuconolactone decarboxylase